MTYPSACSLFAAAHGQTCAGPNRCYYCGAPCDGERPVSRFVLDSFTARDTVADVSSEWICAGCALAMRSDAEVTLADGDAGPNGRTWMYSWLVTPAKATPYATCLMLGGDRCKSCLPLLRAAVLSPPEPPFVLALTRSGQKHILYRAAISRSAEEFVACLEGENVSYRPDTVVARLALLSRLCAATGPRALEQSPSPHMAFRAATRRRDGLADVEEFARIRQEPLTDLARFLLAPKEQNEHDWPADNEASAATAPAGV